jgi:hypothetical protein
MPITSTQIEKIQLDAGLVYVNYGVAGEEIKLGPTRGGGEFTVTPTIRDIEYDGRRGKSKGLQVVDEIVASLKVTLINVSQASLKLALPDCVVDGSNLKNGTIGLIPAAKYLTNITMFAKTADGYYKKIVLFSAMHEGPFTLAAKPKADGEIALEVFAHFDPTDDTAKLYEIADVTSIVAATPVSKTALKSDMDSTDLLTPADYTSASWGDVAVARYLAGLVYANAHALQTEVDAAEDALEAAVLALDTLT